MAELQEIDELFGLFHELAELHVDEFRSRADIQTLGRIRQLISETLVGAAFPEDAQIEILSDWLKALRLNEKQWSQRFADLVVSSEIDMSLEQAAIAKRELIEFANTCPWLPYREIANRVIQGIA
jgi:hypothetical protein